MAHFGKYFQKFLGDKTAQRVLLLYFLIVLIFFGTFAKPDFAADTYAYAMGDFTEITNNFLRCGRIFTAGIYTLLRLAHVNINVVNFGCFIVAITSLTGALYMLRKLLQKGFIKNQLWSFLLPLIILINPFLIEYFLFIEKGIMCFCILLCVVSAYYYNNYLSYRRRNDLWKVLCLNIFATFWYQGVIGLFIILATMLTLMKAKTWRTFLKDTILSVGLYVIGPLLNVIMIKVFFADGRTGGGLDLLGAAKTVFSSVGRMFELFGIIPSCVFWGVLIITLTLWVVYLVRNHRFSWLQLAKIGYLGLVVFLAAVAPQLALNPASVWIAPRAVYPFATIIGVILALMMYFTPSWLNMRCSKISILTMAMVYLAVELIGFKVIILDHYSLAEIDRLRAQYIGQMITDYETDHHVEVKYITTSRDQKLTYSYPGIKTVADSNVSAFSTDWSDVTSISFWNGRDFVRRDAAPAWRDYCAHHDWHNFNLDQFKFSGETLQICLY